MAIAVSSTAFKEGSKIPVKHTCDGQNVSPAIDWGEPPPGTKSFALIVDDPDAPGGTFTHWVLFNIPGQARRLEENTKSREGAVQGKSGFGTPGYGGPCPPKGPAHHYRFNLYALDKVLDLKTGASKQQVLDAMKGHVLEQGLLTATYQR